MVVGNGNVAADVARMLVLTREELEATDTAHYAIEALAEAPVREVVILGRRGPAQAAFTNPEVRELGELVDADVRIDPATMELDDASRAFLDSDAADATTRKNVESFTEFAGREPSGKHKRVELRFLRSPVEIHGDGPGRGDHGRGQRAVPDDAGALRARDTGETERIECGMVLRSIGYVGTEHRGRPPRPRHGGDPERRGAGRRRGRRGRSPASTWSAGSSAGPAA